MFNSRRNRLEEQLKSVEERIERLQEQVDSGLVPEVAHDPDPVRRQAEEMLDRIGGPKGRKAKLRTDLRLAIQEAEHLQLALDQLDNRRLAQVKALLGDSWQLAMSLIVLRWLVGLSLIVSLVLSLFITVAYTLLYDIAKNSRRTLEIIVLEEARRISKEEKISLVEARRRVEDLMWP